MKIITHKGQPFEGPWKRQMHCKKGDCDTVFEIKAEDVNIGYFGGSYREDGDQKLYAECPMCGNCLYVTNIPSSVSKQVYGRNRPKDNGVR